MVSIRRYREPNGNIYTIVHAHLRDGGGIRPYHTSNVKDTEDDLLYARHLVPAVNDTRWLRLSQ